MKRALFFLAALAIPLFLPAAEPTESSATDVRSKASDWPAGVQTISIDGAKDGEAQAAMYYEPGGDAPHPLLVFLHPWGGNYTYKTGIGMAEGCIRNGWAFVQPDFHGPNNRPQALGSDLMIADIANAVAYAEAHGKVDPRRVYLAGASGGGHAALLAVGRLPGLFAAVSAWVPITDLVAWHAQSLGGKHANYARDIEAACGGAPTPGSPAEKEAIQRSPLASLTQAGPIPMDINTAIHDGHGDNSVPVSHSLLAFNLLAAPADRIPEADIQKMVVEEAVPDTLHFTGYDASYAPRRLLFRRASGNVRVTVTDGQHEILVPAALAWLSLVDQANREKLGLPAAVAAPPLSVTFPLLGKVTPRTAKEIGSSSWSIGGEVLDRGFADYDQYKEYLGPLGATAIRLQAGWARTETAKGVYDWAWLDHIIDDALSRGVRPWLQLSYGNPIYPSGGIPTIAGPLPSGEALPAWDAWVRAAVQRYKDRIGTWEIWNEPDVRQACPVEAYAPFFVRTVEIVRQEAPQSRIYALALASSPSYGEKFLDLVEAQGKLGLIDAVTFHHYPQNPDDLTVFLQLKQAVSRYSRPIELREGENGAPSGKTTGALSQYAWSEVTQAKWDLRRMLAYHGNGVAFNLFTISDFLYPNGMNRKGLLESKKDHSIVGPKLAYSAAQAVFSIFDDTVKLQPEAAVKGNGAAPLAAYAYVKDGSGASLVTVWESSVPVAETNIAHEADLEISSVRFSDPVYVDLLSGRVMGIPAENWTQDGGVARFRKIPLYDSPIILADRGAIPFKPSP